MDDRTIIAFIFFGWIPILATGKAIAWIIREIKEVRVSEDGSSKDE